MSSMLRINRSRIVRWGLGATCGIGVATSIHTFHSEFDEPPPPPTSKNEGNFVKDAAETVGVGVTAGVVASKLVTGALCGIGFTEAGVAAKSLAAAYQATIGNVAAGSAFSGLQAVAAKGGVALLGPIGIGAVVVGGGIYVWYKVQQNEIRRLKEEEERKIWEEEQKNKQWYNRVQNKVYAWIPWK